MNKCLYCGKPVKNKYCDVSCQNKHQGSLRANNRYGEIKEYDVLCNNCGEEFKVKERERLYPMKNKYYCSRSCANSRVHSEETKDKIRKSVNSFSNFIRKKQTCLNCGKKIDDSRDRIFCSQNCSMIWRHENNIEWKDIHKQGSIKGGRKSVLSQNRRSKNEKLFGDMCFSFFKNVRFNEPIFNGWDADVIIDDYKLAILWNGNWHYKQIGIKHSLLQVQNRDKIKIKEIIRFGYKPYIIKDLGKYNPEFVESEFEKLKGKIINNNFFIK